MKTKVHVVDVAVLDAGLRSSDVLASNSRQDIAQT